MRYKFTLYFRGGRTEIHEADGYSASSGVLQLLKHTPHPNAQIKIFPMVDISEIIMEDKSA